MKKFSYFLLCCFYISAVYSQPKYITLQKIPGCYNSADGNCSKPKKHNIKIEISAEESISLLEKGFMKKEKMGCVPNYLEIVELAKIFNLAIPTKYNPELVLKVGDFTNFSSQGLNIDILIYEFAVKKAALEALEREKFTIKPRKKNQNIQGILTAIADEIKNETNIEEEWEILMLKYEDCLESDPMICFPIYDTLVFCLRMFRIDEMNEKIANSSFLDKLLEGELLACAKYYKLPPAIKYKCKPSIIYMTGNLNEIFERSEGDPLQINKELAARKIVIDAADLDNTPCFRFKTKGDLSWAAETFVIPRLSASR